VVYLNEILGMSPILATLLNGSLLWGLLFFFPLLNSRLNDNFGLKQSLSISFVSISLGYFLLGNVQRIWPGIIGAKTGEVIDYSIPAILGILLIGIGCSLSKTSNATSIRQTSAERITLGMGIFYLVLNLGSITGRGISYFIRTRGLNLFPLSDGSYLIQVNPAMANIFLYTATVLSLLSLVLVILFFRENELKPHIKTDNGALPRKTAGQTLAGIFLVLKNKNFLFFLIFIGFFWFLYAQMFNLIPLYLRFIDRNAPVGIYTLINPLIIITLQLLFIQLSRKWSRIKTIISGIAIATFAVLVNIIPIVFSVDISRKVSLWAIMIPIAGLFMLLSLASMTIGEMILSSRMVEYIGSISPKGKESFFKGYANLPIATGIIIGAPMGGYMFEHFISAPLKNGENPQPIVIWLALGLIGLVSLTGMALFHRHWIKTQNPET
jgi:MFS family permease